MLYIFPFIWFNINLIILRPDNFENGEAGDEVEELEENEEKKPKKPTKKSNTKSKLDLAVTSDKNNASLLSFFQKTASQKRTASATNGQVEIVSSFLLNRKLTSLKAF